jgi:hypothetical protein
MMVSLLIGMQTLIVHKLLAVPILKVLEHYRIPIHESLDNRIKLLCPFHEETAPSFVVYVDDNVGYCFGCAKRYDAIQIIREREGIRFTQAIQKLAAIGGFTIPDEELVKIRADLQRGIEKIKVDKSDDYYMELKHRIGGEMIVWLAELPYVEYLYHYTQYFWDLYDEIGEEKMGVKELDKAKDLISEWKPFFRRESFCWLTSYSLRKIPRAVIETKTGINLGSELEFK